MRQWNTIKGNQSCQFTSQIEPTQDKIVQCILKNVTEFYQLHREYQTNCRWKGWIHIMCDELTRLLGSCVAWETLAREVGIRASTAWLQPTSAVFEVRSKRT